MWYPVFVVGTAGVLVFSLLLAIAVGSVPIGLGAVARILVDHLLGRSPPSGIADQIVWQFRAPRTMLAALAGAGLAVGGTLLQAVVRNPLADPYVLGLSEGAGLGAVVVIVLAPAALQGVGVSGAAFLGALISLAVVVGLGQRAGRFVPTRLILAGVAVGYLLSAFTSFLEFRASDGELRSVVFWLLGSVAGAKLDQLWLPAACVVAVAIWSFAQGRRLNALLLGEEAALALGVSLQTFRLQILVASALLTGTVVAVAGGIGFVGLIMPHMTRLLVGPDHRRVLPVAVLLGAVFLVTIDLLARTIAAPADLPLSVLTAIVGPNGSGKTTLLRTIYRSLRPRAGTVLITGPQESRDVWALPARDVARRVAVLTQERADDFELSVTEVVLTGRTPHKRLLERDSSTDHRLVAELLDQVGVGWAAGRYFSSLSGGEKQRVLLAKALAQQTDLLLLDEPTNHLDVAAQCVLLGLLCRLSAEGLTVVAVLHDLNLAAAYADHLVVLNHGLVAAAGPPDEVLTETLVHDVFGVRAHCGIHPETGRFHIAVHFSGHGATRKRDRLTPREPFPR